MCTPQHLVDRYWGRRIANLRPIWATLQKNAQKIKFLLDNVVYLDRAKWLSQICVTMHSSFPLTRHYGHCPSWLFVILTGCLTCISNQNHFYNLREAKWWGPGLLKHQDIKQPSVFFTITKTNKALPICITHEAPRRDRPISHGAGTMLPQVHCEFFNSAFPVLHWYAANS